MTKRIRHAQAPPIQIARAVNDAEHVLADQALLIQECVFDFVTHVISAYDNPIERILWMRRHAPHTASLLGIDLDMVS